MTDPYFSIIIPSYNSERTLREAVLSVTGQSFSDIEVLIVDDASTDWSFMIAHELAEEDNRIRVIALAGNGGPAVARNKGIQSARGRYIMFLDADDVYGSELLSRVYDACRTMPDVVLWGNCEEYVDAQGRVKRTENIVPEARKYINAKKLRKSILDLEEKSLYGYLWNKAYLTSAARRIEIPDQSFNEDEMYNIAYFSDINSMTVLDYAGTHYRKRSGSLTHGELADYYPLAMKRVAGLLVQQRQWGLYDASVKKRLTVIYIRYIASTLERMTGLSGQERRLMMQRIFTSKLYNEFIPDAEGCGGFTGIMLKALKEKNAAKCIRIGTGLNAVRRHFPGIFELAKKR